MLDPNELCFPNNIVNLLGEKFRAIDPDTKIVYRPIRDTDDSQTIAVFPVAWQPQQQSKEFLGRKAEPTFQRYVILSQAYIADMDEQRGIRKHSLLSAKVRHTLYRDAALALVLPEAEVIYQTGDPNRPTVREFVHDWDIVGQDYQNQKNPSTNKFIFLSTTEMYVETEFE